MPKTAKIVSADEIKIPVRKVAVAPKEDVKAETSSESNLSTHGEIEISDAKISAKTETVAGETVIQPPIEKAEVKTVAEIKPETVSEKPAVDSTDAKADTDVKTDELESSSEEKLPQLLDTDKYHLPIRERRSSNGSHQTIGFITVFLLLALVGIYLAADAGWIKLGFDLPIHVFKQ